MRGHNLELDMLLRGIVMSRGDKGATISEMRSDYYHIIGEKWPLHQITTKEIVNYIINIDGLMMEQIPDGPCVWYIDDIGINISQEYDSNNNIVNEEHDSNNNVIEIEDSIVSNNQLSNSYVLPAPCGQRRIITSSFVNEPGQQISSSSIDTMRTYPIENGNMRKRNLSEHSPTILHSALKRPKMSASEQLLNEQNLSIHNRENGAPMIRQTTSTEIENSMLSRSDVHTDGGLVIDESLDTINVPQSNQLHV